MLMIVSCSILVVQAISQDTYKKEYHKNYQVEPTSSLSIDNKYGPIFLTSEPGINEVQLDVVVAVEASNEKKGAELLDRVEIHLNQKGDLVSAVTEIESRSKFKNLKIEYRVRFPETMGLGVKNKFGDAVLNRSTGEANLYVGYGTLNIGELMSANNAINVEYGKLNFDHLEAGEVKVSYSDLKGKEARLMNIKAKYSELELGAIGTLDYQGAYDDLSVLAVSNVVVDADYSDVFIERLDSELNINLAYGNLKVDEVKNTFNGITITGAYSDFVINAAGTAYSFDLKAVYGDVVVPNTCKLTNTQNKAMTEIRTGVCGSNGQAQIKGQVSYGDLKIR